MNKHPTICDCGHRIYEHGRRKPPSSPLWEYTGCRVKSCPCNKYKASDGSDWPYGIGP